MYLIISFVHHIKNDQQRQFLEDFRKLQAKLLEVTMSSTICTCILQRLPITAQSGHFEKQFLTSAEVCIQTTWEIPTLSYECCKIKLFLGVIHLPLVWSFELAHNENRRIGSKFACLMWGLFKDWITLRNFLLGYLLELFAKKKKKKKITTAKCFSHLHNVNSWMPFTTTSLYINSYTKTGADMLIKSHI